MAKYRENYQEDIDKAVASGDMVSAALYEQKRNGKIKEQGLPYEQTSTYKKYLPKENTFDIDTDYTAEAQKEYAAGNIAGAYDYMFGDTNSRAAKVKATGQDYGVTNEMAWSDMVKNYSGNKDALNAQFMGMMAQLGQPMEYGGSKHDATYEKLMQTAMGMNYGDWTKGDQYAGLAERFRAAGQTAMDDTAGKIAARTGGLASSYATSAAAQQYNDYMAKLEDVARAQYESERGNVLQNAQLAGQLADRDYNRFMDKYNADQVAKQHQANAIANMIEWQRADEKTEYDRAWNEKVYADNMELQNWEKDMKTREFDMGEETYNINKVLQSGKIKGYLTPEENAILAKAWHLPEGTVIDPLGAEKNAAALNYELEQKYGGTKSGGGGGSRSSNGNGGSGGAVNMILQSISEPASANANPDYVKIQNIANNRAEYNAAMGEAYGGKSTDYERGKETIDQIVVQEAARIAAKEGTSIDDVLMRQGFTDLYRMLDY